MVLPVQPITAPDPEALSPCHQIVFSGTGENSWHYEASRHNTLHHAADGENHRPWGLISPMQGEGYVCLSDRDCDWPAGLTEQTCWWQAASSQTKSAQSPWSLKTPTQTSPCFCRCRRHDSWHPLNKLNQKHEGFGWSVTHQVVTVSEALTEAPFNLQLQLTASFCVHPCAKPCSFQVIPGIIFSIHKQNLKLIQRTLCRLAVSEETKLPVSPRRKLGENRNFVSS